MFTDILTFKDKVIFRILICFWAVSTAIFWIWWLEPRHVGYLFGFILTSFIVAWPMVLFGYCFFFLIKMKKTSNDQPVPEGLGIAMIVTKAPSEPFMILQNTLKSVLAQKYPHDTWVADEDPSAEALDWYKNHNIFLSCRKDDLSYHNDSWPRRKKCKEGNLAYFYEKFGYDKYDVVVQMDVDHQPQENYLEEILKPFLDESVGYVAAPSVCDLNFNTSWAARARVQSEGIFHGPIQSGANAGWVPVCIGSHYAVRTRALKEIGGLGPELAEDYSTTLLFNASKWKGVWAYDAKARGEGPNSFTDLIIQDYQWARSLITLFLTLYPKVWKKLNWKQRLYFTFTQQWYVISVFIWLASVFVIVSTLLIGHQPVNINFFDFLKFITIPYALVFIIFTIVQRKGYMKPSIANIFSWENLLFELARWPWVFVACADAVYSVISSRKHIFKVTPKNKASSDVMTLKIIMPYLLTALVFYVAIIFRKQTPGTEGYLIFALGAAFCYSMVAFIALALHIKEASKPQKLKTAINHVPQFAASLGLTFFVIIGMFVLKSNINTNSVEADGLTSAPVEKIVIEQETIQPKDVLLVTNAYQTTFPSQTFSEYTVKKDDTLRSIAFRYFGDDTDWVYLQGKTGSDPDLISPGEVILIPKSI